MKSDSQDPVLQLLHMPEDCDRAFRLWEDRTRRNLDSDDATPGHAVIRSRPWRGGQIHQEVGYASNRPYSDSKASSDHLARAYRQTYDLNVMTNNCSNNHGPGQYQEKLIPLAITRMGKGESIPICCHDIFIRGWLYVEDHCATQATVMLKGLADETRCVGSDNKQTNLAQVDLLFDLVDQHHSFPKGTRRKFKTFVQDRTGQGRRCANETARVQQELGLRPGTTFSAGLGILWLGTSKGKSND